MEKYPKAVSEMYSQFKQRESNPLEKYVGRLVNFNGKGLEVVGYTELRDGSYRLIVDATSFGGWRDPDADDVVFKDCESYWYANVNDLID